MQRQLDLFFCALQFLTRVPVPSNPRFEMAWITRSARYYPLVGQLIGALCAGVLLVAAKVWPGWTPALLAMAVGVLATGAFHEDGLADTADGLGGGQDRAQRLAIMKDSRIGSYGAIALGLCLALKVSALAGFTPAVAAWLLLAAHGAGRAAAVVAMYFLRHVSDPATAKYKPTAEGVHAGEVLFAVLVALWPLAFLAPVQAVLAVAGGALFALLLALTARRLVGGYTGDVLGAIEQMFELGFLLAAGAAAVVMGTLT
jgi:adenosylcobinamide-GDP ribazoletransferase